MSIIKAVKETESTFDDFNVSFTRENVHDPNQMEFDNAEEKLQKLEQLGEIERLLSLVPTSPDIVAKKAPAQVLATARQHS